MTASSRREALVELAARVEAASGADRELDCRIWAAIGNGDFRVMRAVVPDLTQWASVRAYTTSLDTAMSLVPEGWHTFLAGDDRHSGRWSWHLRGGYGFNAKCRAATPALALTAACLRAIAATGAA